MANEQEDKMREEAKNSLERMQTFDVQTLPRKADLGTGFYFSDAVEPAGRLVDLYKRLSLSALDDFPLTELTNIKNRANEDYSRFDEMLKFNPTVGDATPQHGQILNKINSAYQAAFQTLNPFISYSLHKTADFGRLEGEARSTIQSIRDQAEEITKGLKKDKEAADQVLADVRKVAAEHGVTQQAIYFQESAEKHEKEATRWQGYTIKVAIGLGLFAFLTLFFPKIPWLSASDTAHAIQITVSKTLLFGVIAYMLFLSARNMLAHRHNAIVDRHRQNALMTYKAIVEAAGDTPNREVILVQAGACIFGPQGTGYLKDSTPNPPGAHSVVEFLSRGC